MADRRYLTGPPVIGRRAIVRHACDRQCPSPDHPPRAILNLRRLHRRQAGFSRASTRQPKKSAGASGLEGLRAAQGLLFTLLPREAGDPPPGARVRKPHPALPAEQRERQVRELMAPVARSALGERGPIWWEDGAPELNRHMARTTGCAHWYIGLAAEPG